MYKKILSWLLTLAMIFTMFGGVSISASGLEFNDVENHWAKDSIDQWIEKGLIKGYDDGTFKPNGYITRGEFITLANNVIKSEEEIEINFDDVTEEEWYYKELKKAIFLEYIKGYEDNTFRADQNITRQEVAVILQKIIQLNPSEENALESFSDTSDIPEWSRNALQLAVQKGYLTGYEDNTLKASNYITRAESVKVLSNMFGTIYNEAGVYGSEEDELEVEGNVTVSAEDVTLQNMIIEGDLYLAEGIGEGDVTLDNVTVKGDTIAKGGGENSIIIKNSSLTNLLIIKKNGKIRIVAQGSTVIDKTYLHSSAKLQGEKLNKNSFGEVEIIRVTPGEKIELEGSFTKVDVKAAADIEVSDKSKVEEINVHEDTKNVNIFVSPYSIIDKIYAYTKIDVDNRGVITEALGEFAKTSNYENRLPVNLQPKTSSKTSSSTPTPAAPKYTLSLAVTPDGSGTVSGSGSYEAGKNITISAIAYEGYEFIEWKDGEDQITTAASFGYTTTSENKTFTAYFESTSEFAGGNGTESDPYQVANAEQLDKVRDYSDAQFIQTADIDLTDYVTEGGIYYNDGQGWEPIGNSSSKFQGSFDGNGYTISNLFINRPETSSGDNQGLFGYVDLEGNLVDISLIDSHVYGYHYTGTLAGSNFGEISDCSSTNVEVINTWEYAGGLVGQNSGIISNSFTTGIVKTDDFNAGGLVGYNRSNTPQNVTAQVINCYSEADVTYATQIDSDGYPYNLGGLVGYNSSGTIENSYAKGDVTGYERIGGLIGENGAEVINCYALGDISGTYDNIGGLIGYASSGHSLANSYFNSLQPDNGVGTVKTTAEMQDKDTYTDWDFTNIWTINSNDNGGYPALAWQGYENESDFAGGSGTELDPYQIANAVHLNNVRDYLDAHFIQVADIDLTNYVTEGGIYYNDGEGWEPIGTSENPFTGIYDGQEYSISNLKIIRENQTSIGLFGKTYVTSVINNVVIKGFLIEGYSEVGTLVGCNTGEISNVHIDGLYTTSSIKAYYYYAGGLCGVNQGTITYSSTKDISSISSNESYTGGLVGRSYPLYDYDTYDITQQPIINNSFADNVYIYGKGYSAGLIGGNTSEKIEHCWANATVEGTHRVGGLIGMNSSDVYQSYSLGKVTGTDIYNGMTGGLIGYSMNYFKVENCYSLADVTGPKQVGGLIGRTASYVTNCYSAGKVVGTDNKAEIGGLLGNVASIIEVQNSYWDKTTSGLDTSAGGTGYVTSAMIKSTNSVPIYEGWDFDTIWNIDTGTSYPYLRNNEQTPHPVPPIG
ncbi:MAG: S-layer domain protein [Clostridiales bacterium 38_11]|nr:MAG: S-layer domain protein [Clostridiales bacterium 38_11]